MCAARNCSNNEQSSSRTVAVTSGLDNPAETIFRWQRQKRQIFLKYIGLIAIGEAAEDTILHRTPETVGPWPFQRIWC